MVGRPGHPRHLLLLLLVCGDVETNPGPKGGRPEKVKEPTKEEQMKMLIDQVRLGFMMI